MVSVVVCEEVSRGISTRQAWRPAPRGEAPMVSEARRRVEKWRGEFWFAGRGPAPLWSAVEGDDGLGFARAALADGA